MRYQLEGSSKQGRPSCLAGQGVHRILGYGYGPFHVTAFSEVVERPGHFRLSIPSAMPLRSSHLRLGQSKQHLGNFDARYFATPI